MPLAAEAQAEAAALIMNILLTFCPVQCLSFYLSFAIPFQLWSCTCEGSRGRTALPSAILIRWYRFLIGHNICLCTHHSFVQMAGLWCKAAADEKCFVAGRCQLQHLEWVPVFFFLFQHQGMQIKESTAVDWQWMQIVVSAQELFRGSGISNY